MYAKVFKGVLDVLLSFFLLLLLSPILACTAVLIFLTLGRPVIYKQKRPGLAGKPFYIYKFRTMTNERDEFGQLLSDEKRMTKIGSGIRKLSLDEFPQLINVLKGDMSLIGPRPLLMQYMPLYNSFQKRRHELKPGITGWAQVNGRNGISWDERFKLDVWYVDNCSLSLDLKIIFLTCNRVISKKNIHLPGYVTMPPFQGNSVIGKEHEHDKQIKSQSQKILLSPPDMGAIEKQLLIEAFDSNWIAPLGPQVDLFEKEIAKTVGSGGAVAVSSGTAAIHLALLLLDVGPGDIVFCSSLTFIASANPIIYQGAEPVFVDSNFNSWNMCPEALEKAFDHTLNSIGKLPKAVIVANLYGQSAEMDVIKNICTHYQVPIIEDAAESLGATYKGKASGTFGDFGVYSFNGNKLITTSGGGMLVSNNVEALEKARYLASQAKMPALHYQHEEVGYNYRLSNLLAAVGRGQLKQLEQKVQTKRRIFEQYVKQLSSIDGIEFMPELEECKSSRWLTTMTIDEQKVGLDRNSLINHLLDQNIEARPVWKPLHLQPIFQNNLFYSKQDQSSVSEQLFNNGLCLPSGTSLSNEDQSRVIHSIKTALKR